MFLTRRGARALHGSGIAIALVIALAACGDDDDSSSSGSGGTTTAVSEPAAASGGQADAKEIVARYTKPVPFQIAPLGKTPPKDITVAEVNCTLPICVYGATEGATKRLGWKYVGVPFDVSKGPAAYAAALERALQKKPDYIVNVGIFPPETVKPALAKIKAADIPMIQVIGQPTDPAFASCVNCDAYLGRVGELQADMVVADLGTDAEVVTAGDPTNVGTGQTNAGFTRELKRLGAKESKELDISIAKGPDANSAQVISYLQRNPDVKAVATTFNDTLITLPGALARAGLADKVKFYGSSPKETAIDFTKDGRMAGNVSIQSNAAWWLAVDGFARLSVGEKAPKDAESAKTGWYAMMVKDNADAIVEAGGGESEPPDYANVYAKAWGVG